MFDFNKGQEKTIQEGVDWYFNSSEQIFQLAGNPGTGKSVVMNEIIRRIRIDPTRVAPMAYVGAAAIVMRLKGLVNAKTIHSWLYTPVEIPVLDGHGNPLMDTYFNTPLMELVFIPKDLSDVDIMAIDEGGMVPMNMRPDILSRGKKVLVGGDIDQLWPVKDKPAFLASGEVHVLTEIMRQAEHSSIVYLCGRAKLGLPIHTGWYGDTLVISEEDVSDQILAASPVILCGKNVTREALNKRVRYDIFGKKSIIPDCGEKLICRKNNWNIEAGGINLTNGLTGIVLNQPDVGSFDGQCFHVDFGPALTNVPFNDVAIDYKYFSATPDQRKLMKPNRWQRGNRFEYGYAQTVHLSQGSQWTHGIYFEEYLNPDTNNRLNYTALSRFSDKAIYVKKRRKYI